MASISTLPTEIRLQLLDTIWSGRDRRSLLALAATTQAFYNLYLSCRRRYQLDYLNEHLEVALALAIFQPFIPTPPSRDDQDDLFIFWDDTQPSWLLVIPPDSPEWKSTTSPLYKRTLLPILPSTDSVSDTHLSLAASYHRRILALSKQVYATTTGVDPRLFSSPAHRVWVFYLAISRTMMAPHKELWNWIVDSWCIRHGQEITIVELPHIRPGPRIILPRGMRRIEVMGEMSYAVVDGVQGGYRDCIYRYMVSVWAWLQRTPEMVVQGDGEVWPETLRVATLKVLGASVSWRESQASQRLLHVLRTLSYGIQENLGPLLTHRLLFGNEREKVEVLRCYPTARLLLGTKIPIVRGSLDAVVFEALVKRFGECKEEYLEGLEVVADELFNMTFW